MMPRANYFNCMDTLGQLLSLDASIIFCNWMRKGDIDVSGCPGPPPCCTFSLCTALQACPSVCSNYIVNFIHDTSYSCDTVLLILYMTHLTALTQYFLKASHEITEKSFPWLLSGGINIGPTGGSYNGTRQVVRRSVREPEFDSLFRVCMYH